MLQVLGRVLGLKEENKRHKSFIMETRKQVTFLERDSICQDLQQPCRTSVAVRTLGHHFPQMHDSTAVMPPLAEKIAEMKERKAGEYRVMLQQLSLSPQLKTIHIPRSVESAPFLQHPGLKTGQKRYLYSIANIYSTDHMHKLMQRQYLSMLQHRTQLGYITPHECQKYTDYLIKQSQKETWMQSSSRSSTSQSSVKQSPTLQPGGPISLPKIGNSSQRLHSGAPTKINFKAKRAYVQLNQCEQIQKQVKLKGTSAGLKVSESYIVSRDFDSHPQPSPFLIRYNLAFLSSLVLAIPSNLVSSTNLEIVFLIPKSKGSSLVKPKFRPCIVERTAKILTVL
uniref:protein FAM216A n=1 Tax=Pristiophorus japonicus TaxID=55135 RepID=UPI00398F1EEA